MTDKQAKTMLTTDRLSYLWLGIGFAMYVFGNGRWVIPIATWFCLVFILRFTRTQKPIRGYLITVVVFILGYLISWQGTSRAPLVLTVIMAVIVGVLAALPFLADRLIAHRFHGILSTLVFPLSLTALAFFNSFGQYGSMGSLAYTQYGNLPLLQLVSVTGISGVTFLISWFASVINWAWEKDFQWLEIRLVTGSYTCVLVLVLLFGGARLALFPPEVKTVRVASVTTPGIRSQFNDFRRLHKFQSIEKTIEVLEDLSVKAARSGAKIIFWQEYGALLSSDDEEAFIERCRNLAIKENIYLMPGIGVFSPGSGEKGKNKAILIDPSGEIAWEYLKHHPVPGIESPFIIPGDGKIPDIKTPFGKIAPVICFDMDFPNYIRQAGKTGVDLLLDPSFDWKEITPWHTQMATFRAIENGFSMIRCTGEGLSIAVDYQGRTRSFANYFKTDEPVMISDVPIKGVTTIYSQIGDLFAWICIAGFVMLVALAIFRRD